MARGMSGRILLVGGSGFVGLNIAEALVGRGDDVAIFSPAPIPEAAAASLARGPGRHAVIEGDVRDPNALAAACAGRDALVHVAAVTAGATNDLDRAVEILDINTLGTARALNAARRAGVGRVVFTGSGSVYGESATAAPELGETDVAAVPETVYAISKYAAERLAIRARRTMGQDVRCLRLGAVFGPWERDTGVRDTLSPIFQVTQAALAGDAVVLPRPGRRDWIYARDVAGAVLAALDHPRGFDGVINVAPGTEWSVADWCERLAARLPGFGYTMARVGHLPTVDYHGPGDRSPLANRRLVEELGFTPRFTLDAAFEDYMAWLARQGADR